MNLGTQRGKSRGADDSWSLFEGLFCFPCESFLSISIKSNLWLLKIIGLNDLGKMMRGEGKDNDDDDDVDGDDGDGDDDDCVGESLRIKPLRRFVCIGHWYGQASSQAGGGTLH